MTVKIALARTLQSADIFSVLVWWLEETMDVAILGKQLFLSAEDQHCSPEVMYGDCTFGCHNWTVYW